MTQEPLPDLLAILHYRYEKKIQIDPPTLGYPLFRLDLSEFKLNLSDEVPVLWLRREDLRRLSPLNLVQSMNDATKLVKIFDAPVLVLVEGQAAGFRSYAPHFGCHYVFFDESQQLEVINSRRPLGHLLDIIVDQLLLTEISPYRAEGIVTGSRFFNRSTEKNKILAHLDESYLIVGIRQIGKTSLMKEIIRELELREKIKEGEGFFKYFDCSQYERNDQFIRDVVRWLHINDLTRVDRQDPNFFFPNFLERMRKKYQRRILFFLDEIDQLVAIQGGSADLFNTMRASFQQGSCNFIMAGWRGISRESSKNDSALYNFADRIELNEFTRMQAREMILVPFDNMRINLADREEVVSRIYAETAGRPNLIQVYCQILVEELEAKQGREISVNSLFDVYSNVRLKGRVISSFLDNSSPSEKIIVFSLLITLGDHYGVSFDLEDIDKAVKVQGVNLPLAQIVEGLRLLQLAGILRSGREGQDYSFTSPIIARILSVNCNPKFSIKKSKEEYQYG